VCLDGVHRLPALFLLRGIRRAAPAQVTACRVVTLIKTVNAIKDEIKAKLLTVTITDYNKVIKVAVIKVYPLIKP